MKKAIFYTMDAVLASLLLLGAVAVIFYVYDPADSSIEQEEFISQDILTILSEIRIYELNNSFVAQEIANGNITDINKTALDQIGEYWALNHIDKAQMLLHLIVNDSIPTDHGVKTSMGNNTLFLRNVTGRTNVVSANRMISGIEQGRPVSGSSGTSYLKKIRNKKTSSYSYFGGFVGQGNITIIMDLPSDFNSSRLLDAQMKLDTPGTFNLYINGIQCGSTYTGSATQVSLWDITSCNTSFENDSNIISLRFTSGLNMSYVSGGFIKATYTTDTLIENTTLGYARYYFPDINGFINFYDTLSVQGNIINWTLNVTFFNPYQTFMTVGNETIFLTQGNDTANQTIIYSRYNQMLPQAPIPIRLAVTNFSNITTTLYGRPADTFIITDTSGSMADCIGPGAICRYQHRPNTHTVWSYVNCTLNESDTCAWDYCDTNDAYTRSYVTICNQTKLSVAQSVDNTFVDTIFNASAAHSIGLVDYDTRSNTLTNLTTVAATLHGVINSYVDGGSTCTCCGINRARNSINSSENTRFMILLSDGEPNVCCRNLSDYIGTTMGCTGNNSAINWSIRAGQEACKNNITVFTIGFGTGMSASGHYAMQQTACNLSLYYNATESDELKNAFDNITQQILIAANFSSQTVTVKGNFTPSKLFGNSYIDLFYVPLVEQDSQSKISLVSESSQFNTCTPSIIIPANIAVQDAFITSYSGSHWTKSVTVNGQTVFNLTNYGSEYLLLGDPFVVQIPSVVLQPGVLNNITLSVGDSPDNSSNCSANNTLIYTALINVSTGRTDALANKVGCKWVIASSSGSIFNVTVPKEYAGEKACSYNGANITYDHADVYDVAVYNMLKQLDYEGNGQIFFDLAQNDLEIILITTSQVAYMWGPSLMRIEVWQ